VVTVNVLSPAGKVYPCGLTKEPAEKFFANSIDISPQII
jgi:hypothetical protein